MSKHIQKYPGLYAGCKAAGVHYQTAYIRVSKLGWSVERAISTPVGKCGRPRGVKQGPRPRTPVLLVPPWEQPDWVRVPIKRRVVREQITKSSVPRKPYTPRVKKDTAPAHIRKLRATFCDHFIRTGEIDQALMAQLRDYANAVRTSKANLARVPDEPTAQDRGQEGNRFTDNRSGDAHSVDRQTARRIADFLRT